MRGNLLTYVIIGLAALLLIGGGFSVYQYLTQKDPTAALRKQEASRTSTIAATSKVTTKTAPTSSTSGESNDLLPPGVREVPGRLSDTSQNSAPLDISNSVNRGAITDTSKSSIHPDVTVPVPDLSGSLREGANRRNGGTDLGRVEIQPDRYRFNNLSPSAIGDDPVAVKGDGKSYDLETFAPEGEQIETVLATNAASDSSEVPVQASVYLPFYYKGNMLFPIGTRLLGSASAGSSRNRMKINFSKAILKGPRREDIGKSVPLQGIACDLDGTVGIEGYRIGNDLLTTLVPILLQFSQAFTASLQQTQNTTDPYTGQSNVSPVVGGVRNSAIQAGSSAVSSIDQLIAQDVSDNKPYVLVLAGTRMKVILKQALDTSKNGYGL